MDSIVIPQILLPRSVDMSKWAVNACDQFTSDLSYWRELKNYVSDCPSTLNIIFPEIYLKDRPEERIAKINQNMRAYLDGGIFKTLSGGFILVERTTPSGVRTGIVLAVDLESYSFSDGAKTPIRSTEATIPERIPPRVQIRKNAPVELPHVMLLYNDSEGNVLKNVERGKVLYDFELNMNGGSVRGTFIENSEEVKSKFYSLCGNDGFLFAVGDGNHSLAAAKTCWEQLKPSLTQEQLKTHPARFALCEAVNVFDKALKFEPIHRYVNCSCYQRLADGIEKLFGTANDGAAVAKFLAGGKEIAINFGSDVPEGIRKLDKYVSRFIEEYGGEADYIHGEKQLKQLTEKQGVGVLIPPIDKNAFFALIEKSGNLPHKTFSMGEGNEKRYYIEAKKITV